MLLGTNAELTTSTDDWTLDLSAIAPLADATYEVTAMATDAQNNTTTDSSSNEYANTTPRLCSLKQLMSSGSTKTSRRG